MVLHRVLGLALFVLVVGALAAAVGVGAPDASAAAQPQTRPIVATLGDQVDLAVTVYNSNVALVRDVREVTLPAGLVPLHLADIAATVNPTTVHFRSLTDPARLSVLEQNYQFDLLDPQRLLRKYVGRDVTIVRMRQEGGSTVSDEVRARLLALNDGPVWQIGNEIVTGLSADQLRFPEIPENLHSRPTLVWQVDNGGPQRHRIEASYLAGRMTWSADYVLTVGRDDVRADLNGWVTVSNTSGTSYRNARLQLVAGELNRVHHAVHALEESVTVNSQRAAAAPAFTREAFSEYHLYSLERRSTLSDNETKQIAMLEGTRVPVRKVFVVNGQQVYYRNPYRPGSPIRDTVEAFYAFRNDSVSGLGEPMPAGIIRVYQSDTQGGVHFAGEDRIGHTPKDENVQIKIGSVFDVICERRQTDYTRISPQVSEMAYEMTLRNHKGVPITVEVNEPFAGDWTILSSTHQAQKTDAWAARFVVPVAASGDAVLRYRVRVRW